MLQKVKNKQYNMRLKKYKLAIKKTYKEENTASQTN